LKKVLFYSSVTDISLFNTQYFYRADIQILEELGYEVIVSNRLIDFFICKSYDLAFLYFYRYSFFAAFAAYLLRKKIYFTGGIDDLNFENTTFIKYHIQIWLFCFCYFLSNKCLIVSKSDLSNVRNCLKFQKKNKLILSYHSIEVEKYSQQTQEEKSNDFVTICWMGSIPNVKRKGVDLSILIFDRLIKNEKFKYSNFYIIGKNGEAADYIKQLIKELNLEQRVIILGEVSEKKKLELLKSNKFYFQLSKYEGFGIAALEALASGAIVIHSGNGGLKDSVSDFGIELNISEEIDNIVKDALIKIENFTENNNLSVMEYVNQHFTSAKRMKTFAQAFD
jgi:glycosyltransferase involved in cell wall biosynthesis